MENSNKKWLYHRKINTCIIRWLFTNILWYKWTYYANANATTNNSLSYSYYSGSGSSSRGRTSSCGDNNATNGIRRIESSSSNGNDEYKQRTSRLLPLLKTTTITTTASTTTVVVESTTSTTTTTTAVAEESTATTLDTYYSLTPDIGNGSLYRQIRVSMQYTNNHDLWFFVFSIHFVVIDSQQRSALYVRDVSFVRDLTIQSSTLIDVHTVHYTSFLSFFLSYRSWNHASDQS